MIDDNTNTQIRNAAIAAKNLFDTWRGVAPSPHGTTVSDVLAVLHRAAVAWERAANAVAAMAKSHTKE